MTRADTVFRGLILVAGRKARLPRLPCCPRVLLPKNSKWTFPAKKMGGWQGRRIQAGCRPPRTRTPTASILAAGKRICPCQRMVRLFEKRETRFPSVSFHSRACLTRYLHTKKSSVAHAGKCPCAEHFLKEIPRFFADGPHRQPPGKRRKPPAGGVLFAASLQ